MDFVALTLAAALFAAVGLAFGIALYLWPGWLALIFAAFVALLWLADRTDRRRF